MKTKIELDLAVIAARLEGLEETIIHKLIDRAQFAHNPSVYKKGESGFTGNFGSYSLFELRLVAQERMDSEFGRFCVAEERPFTKDLPPPRRVVNLPETGLYLDNFEKINLTEKILSSYLKLVPLFCKDKSDGHFGSSVEHDVYALQAIARRIHFGAAYVAESKYRAAPDLYDELIDKNDVGSMLIHLTRPEVEEKIIHRVGLKARALQSNVNHLIRNVINPDLIVSYYKEWIIPLTKEGEIAYLLNRNRN